MRFLCIGLGALAVCVLGGCGGSVDSALVAISDGGRSGDGGSVDGSPIDAARGEDASVADGAVEGDSAPVVDAASVTCGTKTCGAAEYCVVQGPGGPFIPDGGDRSDYSCKKLPVACGGIASCACVLPPGQPMTSNCKCVVRDGAPYVTCDNR